LNARSFQHSGSLLPIGLLQLRRCV